MSREDFDMKMVTVVRKVEDILDDLFKNYKERFNLHPSSQETCNEDIISCNEGNTFFGRIFTYERK